MISIFKKFTRTCNRSSSFRSWSPILLGAILGFIFSTYHLNTLDCDKLQSDAFFNYNDLDSFEVNINSDDYDDDTEELKISQDDEEDDFEPRIITDPELKPKIDPNAKNNIVRPRYISTELGIREKLFTAIISSQETIHSLGVAVNKTMASHMQKMVFYVENSDETNDDGDSQVAQEMPKDMTVVTNEHVSNQKDMLYQSLLDIYHKFHDIYDWFYIANDATYTQPHRLIETVNHMSITRLLYMGTPKDTTIISSINESPDDDNNNNPNQKRNHNNYQEKIINGKYCDAQSGFIISRALLIELVPRLVDCLTTISSNEPDIWLGQCIISLTAGKIGCVAHEEEEHYISYVLRDKDLQLFDKKLTDLQTNTDGKADLDEIQDPTFLKALSVSPISSPKMMYLLHRKFCQVEIEQTYLKIEKIQSQIKKLAPKTPAGDQKLSWPIGVNAPFQPSQRWDIITWDYFTENYSLSCPGEIPKCDLTETEKMDLKFVLEQALQWLNKKYNPEQLFLIKKSLENGYKRFDPQRGMDYILDIQLYATDENLEKSVTSNIVLDAEPNYIPNNFVVVTHRVQILKPLSHVEIVPMPYVTENTEVNILLPVRNYDKHLLEDYLNYYDKNILSKNDNADLTIIFVYTSKEAQQLEANGDIYEVQKEKLNQLEKKYADVKNAQNGQNPEENQNKIVPWMSVKTDNFNFIKIVDVIGKTKRFNENSLFFMNSAAVRLTSEYLNRCRMNAIRNWQVFFPIPFAAYNPDLIYDKSKNEYPPEEIEIKAAAGHFDIYDYDNSCFYFDDYSKARAKLRTDYKLDMYGMFIEKSDVHVFRAVEASLKRTWILKECKNFNVDNEMKSFLTKMSVADRFCVRSNAEGLAPRSVLGTKLYPEPN